MKPTKKMTFALGLLLAGACSAQTTTANSNLQAGLLGERYAEFEFGAHDLKLVGDNAYALGVGANLPVVPSLLDAGASYTYDWIGGSARTHRNTFAAYATAYRPLNRAKVFSGLAIGWHTGGFGVDDQALWGATLGVEIPAGNLTFTPRLNYLDDFQVTTVSRQQWSWALESNLHVDSTTSLFLSVGRSTVLRSPDRSWDYQAGLRIKI